MSVRPGSDCEHGEMYSRWHYEGDLLKGASGYCEECDQGWELNWETKQLEPTRSARSEYRWQHELEKEGDMNQELVEKIKPYGPGLDFVNVHLDFVKVHEEKLIKAYALYKLLPPKDVKQNITAAVEKGLIAKAQLVHGAIYLGHCRNARVAIWDAQASLFIHMREKFGSVFPETIPHPEDCKGFDIFTPVERLT